MSQPLKGVKRGGGLIDQSAHAERHGQRDLAAVTPAVGLTRLGQRFDYRTDVRARGVKLAGTEGGSTRKGGTK